MGNQDTRHRRTARRTRAQPLKADEMAKAMVNQIKKGPKWHAQAKTEEGWPIAQSREVLQFIAAILTGLWPMSATDVQKWRMCPFPHFPDGREATQYKLPNQH